MQNGTHVPETGKKRGRKAADTEPATKRIAQVRTAARAYRERKEAYVANLEATVRALQTGPQLQLTALSQRVQSLESENSLLKQMAFPFTSTPSLLPISPPADTEIFAWSNQLAIDPSETLTHALFANAPSPLVAMESFRQSHMDNKDFLFDLTLDKDLEALLNAPLPIISASHDAEVVKSYLAKSKRTLLSIPALMNEKDLVDELFLYYTNFILFETDVTTPIFCRVNFAKIQVFQGRVIGKCVENIEDSTNSVCGMGKVMKVFEAIKKEFGIHLDDVLAHDPELRGIEI
ncbi:hypothetical protein HDU98_011797 [Podochytrium sp. JEL0797]|nr:hypothetical protein HDU98_011797 [Podochytrium sp. JEL0797]